MRKEIEKIINDADTLVKGSNKEEWVTDQICSLMAERLEKTRNLFASANNEDIDNLIKEIKGE